MRNGLLALAVVVATGAAPAQDTSPSNAQAPTVLFMCPHGAAKSVLASAHFRRLAKERGLNVRVDSAGTEPDPTIAPAVARHLEEGGYDVPATKPRRATRLEMATADVIVSIGCDRGKLTLPRGQLIQWDDVPSPSQDLAAADARIKKLVVGLVDELLRRQNASKSGRK